MIYLAVFLSISLYLYTVEKKVAKNFLPQFIVWLPAFIVFVSLPALQNGVGTDYEVYFNYFYNNGHILHLNRGEALYYYLVKLVIFLGDPQIQFVLVSLVQGALFFYLLFLLKNLGFKSWLVFLIFFLATGIYHNQMNGLRQYICVYIVPIAAIYVYQKEYLKFGSWSFVSSLIHVSSLIPNLSLYFLSLIKIKNKIILFLIFVLSFFVYSIDYSSYIFSFLEFFEIRYLTYADTKYSEGRSLLSLATKFYYMPVVLLFWFYYLKDKTKSSDILSFFVLIFSLTYFMFLQSKDFDLLIRIWSFFNFFIVFPLYYIMVKCNRISFLIVMLYLLLFYILKVIFFPVAEYDYSFYRGWF